MVKPLCQVIIFVEGDSEKEFYESLLVYYKANSITPVLPCKIYNIKGTGRFETKVPAKLKHELTPKFAGLELKVICCYDTDVFELAQKPPTNWKIVREKVSALGCSGFYEIKAVSMIEDWFLKDINGLCRFLNIKPVKSIEGKNGYERMKKLFKKGNKIYQKGSNSHKFIQSLDIKLLREKILNETEVLEKALGVTILPSKQIKGKK